MAIMLRVQTVLTGVGGSPYYQTLNFMGGSLVDAQAVHARTTDFWIEIQDLFHSDIVAVVQPEVVAVAPETGQAIGQFVVPQQQITGTASGQLLPRATQALMQLTTGQWRNGRQVRGRSFLPGLTEPSSDNGMPVAPVRTQIRNAAVDLLGPPPTRWGVYSTTNREFIGAIGVDVWSEWAILRSRRD